MEQKPIRLAHVELNEAAKKNVQDCLDTGMLARGKYVQQFEEIVADYVGAKYGVAVGNGTMADILLMRAMKEIEGWEHVQVPALTFAAQIASVIHAGLRPVFVDLRTGTLCMDATRGPRFDVALLGNRTLYAGGGDCLDSCEAFYRGAAVGVRAATFSFYATHVIGIGEGGMICTNDLLIAEMCERLRDHGQWPSGSPLGKFRHFQCGYNAKLSNLSAAVGCGMMQVADDIVAKRQAIAQGYYRRLLDYSPWGIGDMRSAHGFPCLHWTRDRVIVELHNAGIEARRLFSLMPEERAFRKWDMGGRAGQYANADHISKRGLYLPCHQGMSESDVDRVCSVVESVKE